MPGEPTRSDLMVSLVVAGFVMTRVLAEGGTGKAQNGYGLLVVAAYSSDAG